MNYSRDSWSDTQETVGEALKMLDSRDSQSSTQGIHRLPLTQPEAVCQDGRDTVTWPLAREDALSQVGRSEISQVGNTLQHTAHKRHRLPEHAS